MNTKDVDKKVDAIIESLWNEASDNNDGDCDDCKYSECYTQHHPYGSTTAAETLCECRVEDYKDCPVVEQIVAALHYKVTTVVKPPEVKNKD